MQQDRQEAESLRNDPKLIQLAQFLSLFQCILKLKSLDKVPYRSSTPLYED